MHIGDGKRVMAADVRPLPDRMGKRRSGRLIDVVISGLSGPIEVNGKGFFFFFWGGGGGKNG